MPKSLTWLEAAYRIHDPGMVELKTDPLLDPLRNQPRFKEIQRKLDLRSSSRAPVGWHSEDGRLNAANRHVGREASGFGPDCSLFS